MRIIEAGEIAQTLDYHTLVEEIRLAFREGAATPPRMIYPLEPTEDHNPAISPALAIMPAWQNDRFIVIKLLSIFPRNTFPSNSRDALPTIQASILVMSAKNGQPLAVVDGTEVTRRRTAATSALASYYLSRSDAATLLMVGTGAQARYQIEAHCSIRPITRVTIWGRNTDKAHELALEIRQRMPDVVTKVSRNLAECAVMADIISCATASPSPLIYGAWLKPGSFLDLVGAHTPKNREADAAAIVGSSVFVDSRTAALREAGDLLIPIQQGVVGEDVILGDLEQLCLGQLGGRSSAEEITLFKSVGIAIEDLAAVNALFSRAS